MAHAPAQWPGSAIDNTSLSYAIDAFLRTHRNGHRLLTQWLQSMPADRTEEQYERETSLALADRGRYMAQFGALRADAVRNGPPE